MNTATNITAIISMSPLENIDCLNALSDYLEDNGHPRAKVSMLGREQFVTARLELVTDEDQLDLLDFISELPWQFPDTARVTLRPEAGALLH